MTVPMLDEGEHNVALALYMAEMKSGRRDAPAMMAYYRERTGVDGGNPDAIMHHCLALYGPECTHCGRPLRTPDAPFCAACGKPR